LNPNTRILCGLVAVAVAIRVTVDLLRPVLGYLIAGIAVAGVVVAVRWWRDRW
jgi:hypothetical protein